MAEHILGMGTKRGIRQLIDTASTIINGLEGQSKKIIAKAPGIQVEAAREEFAGPFTTYRVRLEKNNGALDALRKASTDWPESCRLKDEEDFHIATFVCLDGEAGAKEVRETLDHFGEHYELPEVWRAHAEDFYTDPISVELLFQAMVQYRASDIHLSPGTSPIFRVDSEARPSELVGKVSAAQIDALIKQMASDAEWKEFEDDRQTSFHFHQVGLGYARVSAFHKAGVPHCTLRFLPEKIPSFEDLHIPGETLRMLANMHHGLILVTGMTGSGKSTTVAAMVDWINSNKPVHILTIENPVEYVHKNKRAIMSQRTTGKDVRNFRDAVTGALRHDPDVIVIGEMRDPDTIRAAINAAATGHLVISTLHSNTAYEVVNRVVSFFDPVERDLVKLQLRDCLRCVICQRLVPRIGQGRVPALEFMFNDIKAINDCISAGNTDGIRIGMQQTVSHSFVFEEYLHKLYKDGAIDLDHAREFSTDASVLDQMVMGTYSVPRLDTIKDMRKAGQH